MPVRLEASLVATFAAAMVAMGSPPAQAAEVKLIASAAVKEAGVDPVPAFEQASGRKVAAIGAGTDAMTKRIGGGEVVDIVVIVTGVAFVWWFTRAKRSQPKATA